MSYEVLARRWRPQRFDDVAGQQHVTTVLRNALLQGRLPHAILLTGPRGVGKTSIARILARCLNCEKGPTDQPCGTCASCREIGGSASLDVQEIDAASHTGVDNVREIRESVRYAAAPGKHRIYIIDEVHMLSTAAFNALLKTLEEPPPHSLFVLATTDPQKIPATVLSRVQRFDLKRIGPREILERLQEIVRAEGIEVADSVLRAVVREGDGSLRDAQTLLDRLLSGSGERVTEEDAARILDLTDRKLLADILDPILAGDPNESLCATRRALERGIEPARLAGELLEEIRSLVVARLVDDPADLIDAAEDEIDDLRRRARPHDAETLQRLFRVLLSRCQELTFAPRPDHALEMAVARLATLPEAEALATLLARLDGLASGDAPDGGGAGPSGGRSARSPRPAASEPPRGACEARNSAVSEREPPRLSLVEPTDGTDETQESAARPTRSAPSTAHAQARLRARTKNDPKVREVIEIFDAQLREIRPVQGCEIEGERT